MLTTIMTLQDVTWDTSTNSGFSISGTQLTGQSAVSDWVSEIKSSNNDNSVQFTTTTHNDPYVIAGLAKDPFSSPTATHTSVEFGIMKKPSSYAVYEAGVNKFETTAYSMDDDIEMKISQGISGYITYYIDDNLIYTSTTQTTQDLYAHATAYGAGVIPAMKYGTLSEGDSGSVNAHAHLKPLHIFRRQRDWF